MVSVGAAGWLIFYPELKAACEMVREDIITSGSCSYEQHFKSQGEVSDPTFNKAMSLNTIYHQYRWCQIMDALMSGLTVREAMVLESCRSKMCYPVNKTQLSKLNEEQFNVWQDLMDRIQELKKNHGKIDN